MEDFPVSVIYIFSVPPNWQFLCLLIVLVLATSLQANFLNLSLLLVSNILITQIRKYDQTLQAKMPLISLISWLSYWKQWMQMRNQSWSQGSVSQRFSSMAAPHLRSFLKLLMHRLHPEGTNLSGVRWGSEDLYSFLKLCSSLVKSNRQIV